MAPSGSRGGTGQRRKLPIARVTLVRALMLVIVLAVVAASFFPWRKVEAADQQTIARGKYLVTLG